jgi:ribokinase
MGDVVVVGSVNVDIAVVAARHPLPGETVVGSDVRQCTGGKGANQAIAAARAGASARLVAAVGDDAGGEEAVGLLAGSGVDTGAVLRRPGTPTGTALIVVAADGENTIVVVAGANGSLTPADVAAVPVTAGDVVLAQCETPLDTTAALFERARAAGARCILNPAPALLAAIDLLGLVDVVVLNETELALLGGSTDDLGGLRRLGLSGTAVLTLGARGALALDADDRVLRVPGHVVEVVDTTGAGDCFVGSLAADLAAGRPLDAALTYANAAAARCVTRPGAAPSMPRRAEVRS